MVTTSTAFRSCHCIVRVWRDGRLEALHDVPVAVDQKLGEIPLDLTSNTRTGILSEVGVQGSLVGSFHGNLRVHREGHAVLAGTESFDLFVRTGFPDATVVGREPSFRQWN